MTTLAFRDLSPYTGSVGVDDEAVLARASQLDLRRFLVGIDTERDDDGEWSPLVERGIDGRWWAGRYIGFIRIGDHRIVIEPRLGISVIESWLDQAFGLAAPPASAHHEPSATFIVRLLARLWCRSIAAATRHGLPLLRLPRAYEGLYVRGRLDTRRTLELRGEGRGNVASVTSERSLDHPITRAIVCAYRVLGEQIGDGVEWRTDRVKQVIPALRGAVGSRPRLPSLVDLSRVRYTPITIPYERAATLSHHIASRLGYSATEDSHEAEGVLIDVAELWELFVLNCTRRALPVGLRVEHGTTGRRRDHLLRSTITDTGLGRLKPDVLVLSGDRPVAIIDAKYKRLVDTRERPNGVDPADLYQLAAYALRYRPTQLAALVYPDAAERTGSSKAERDGPWQAADLTLSFLHLPINAASCSAALAHLIDDSDRLRVGMVDESVSRRQDRSATLAR